MAQCVENGFNNNIKRSMVRPYTLFGFETIYRFYIFTPCSIGFLLRWRIQSKIGLLNFYHRRSGIDRRSRPLSAATGIDGDFLLPEIFEGDDADIVGIIPHVGKLAGDRGIAFNKQLHPRAPVAEIGETDNDPPANKQHGQDKFLQRVYLPLLDYFTSRVKITSMCRIC